MRNIGALLEAAGAGFEHVVRTTVFLADMNDFAAMNEVYAPLRRRSAAGARDGAGRAAAARRAGRDRRDRGARVAQVNAQGRAPVHRLRYARAVRSTPSTPSTPLIDLITFSRCFTSRISTVMSMRAC